MKKFRLFDYMDGSYSDYPTLAEAEEYFQERLRLAEEDEECDIVLMEVLKEYNNISHKMHGYDITKFNC